MLHSVILVTDSKGKKYITLTFGKSVEEIETINHPKTFDINHKFVQAKEIKVLDYQKDVGYTHFDALRFIRKFAAENKAEGVRICE